MFLGVVYSDLAGVLSVFGFSFTAVISIGRFVLRGHVLHVRPAAHLRSARRRVKVVLVLDDKGTAGLTPGRPLRQLRQLQTCLQRPSWVISENGQRVNAVAEATVEGGGARSLLRVQAGAQVTAPAVRPGPWRILLGVPSVPKDKCQRSTRPNTNKHALPGDTHDKLPRVCKNSHAPAVAHVLYSVHALQRRDVKGRGVRFPSPLVIIGYDVLSYVILLEG